jgi:hypothetical protein
MSDMSPAVVAQGILVVGPLAHSFTCDETEDLQMERFCATNCVDVKWYVTVRHNCKRVARARVNFDSYGRPASGGGRQAETDATPDRSVAGLL